MDPLFQKLWTVLNFKVLTSTVQRSMSGVQHREFSVHGSESSVQSPASSVQRPDSNVQSPASSVQSPESRVQRPEPSVQGPVSWVQRPGSNVQLLRPESRNSDMPHFFTRDVEQHKNTPLCQLYQPSRTSISQNIYYQLLSPSEYCKVFKSSFSIETSRSSCLKMFFKQVFLKVSETSQESTCAEKHLIHFLKNLLAAGLQLY